MHFFAYVTSEKYLKLKKKLAVVELDGKKAIWFC